MLVNTLKATVWRSLSQRPAGSRSRTNDKPPPAMGADGGLKPASGGRSATACYCTCLIYLRRFSLQRRGFSGSRTYCSKVIKNWHGSFADTIILFPAPKFLSIRLRCTQTRHILRPKKLTAPHPLSPADIAGYARWFGAYVHDRIALRSITCGHIDGLINLGQCGFITARFSQKFRHVRCRCQSPFVNDQNKYWRSAI